jgi:hypothetical protein
MHIRSHVVLAIIGFVIPVAAASCGRAPEPVEQAGSVNPLQGVWSVSEMTPGSGSATITPPQPGLFIFTERYYSAVHSLGGEPRSRSAVSFSPTAEEKVAQYDSIIANAGTYDVSGSTVTFRPQIAKSPEFVGGQSTMNVQIDGDVLTFTATRVVAADGASAPDASGTLMKLRRVE